MNTVIIACFFLLRELEVAAVKIGHVCLDRDARELRLHLPVSKTDVSAVGCVRAWKCLCRPDDDRPKHERAPCAFCAAMQHHEALKELYGVRNFAGRHFDWPYFPQANGRVIGKEHFVRTIEHLGQLCGEQLRDAQGARRFGGHSCRVTAARWLAALGLPVDILKSLARWDS